MTELEKIVMKAAEKAGRELNTYVNIAKDLIDDEEDSIFYQEPCTDAVSRESVLGAICDYVAFEEYEDKSHTFTIRPLTKRIKQLPSVTQKSGHWTKDFICSICGCKCYPFDIDFGDYNYCPNCGAKMESEEQTG